jgi:uncharacterized protein (UPF0261 family)
MELFEKREFDGIIALGDTMGTSLALRVFRQSPVSLTKVLVSTVALSYFVTPQTVGSDIIMIQVATDLWELNRMAKRDLKKAALVVVSAVEGDGEISEVSTHFIAITNMGRHISNMPLS